jgi:hypothetical protein
MHVFLLTVEPRIHSFTSLGLPRLAPNWPTSSMIFWLLPPPGVALLTRDRQIRATLLASPKLAIQLPTRLLVLAISFLPPTLE